MTDPHAHAWALVYVLKRYGIEIPLARAHEISDALAAPENRDALVAWLVEAGVLVHAGAWDAPDVTEALIEAQHEVDNGAGQPVDTTNMTAAEAREAIAAHQAARQRLWDLRELDERVTVYYEDEDRPPDAVPLYRVAGLREADRA